MVSVAVIVVLVLLLMAEWDRQRSINYEMKWYYADAFPLPLMGIYNSMVRLTHPGQTHKFDPNDFEGHHIMSSAWPHIRQEALEIYRRKHTLLDMKELYDGFSTIDADPGKWKVFVLKWYDKPLRVAKTLCPKTVSIINQCPDVHAAMFSIIEPGKFIPEHKGPFVGCLRYHLGLLVPQDRANCYIDVNRERFHWEEGKAFVFDDTYVHSVYNNTNEPRIILFVDIERPLYSPVKQLTRYLMGNGSITSFVKGVNDASEKAIDI